jgi:hypothetical protein
MRDLTRRPGFWIGYAVLSLLALVVALKVFPLAIPLVNLDIGIDRAQALDKAQAIAAERKLPTAGARSAARFRQDEATQNYVELEGGGKEAFAKLTRGDVYSPYWWEVRLFSPGVVDEATLAFKPDGALRGFARRLSEKYVRDPATKALAPADARILAEKDARDWGVDLGPYTLLESSSETQSSGRVDHRFVYERPYSLGEAKVRLRLALAGDELVEITPFVHVPQAFNLRFEELRSANKLIGNLAGLGAGLLWGVGGCLLGVLWLLRRRYLIWRPPLVAGAIVGALLAAALLASAPSAWFDADTTMTPLVFWGRHIGLALLVFVGGGLALGEIFMAAESLSRRAFPHHPQLWRLWSRDAAPTRQVLGRTLGGYMFVPIELALIALFYYGTNRWLGWWQPSEVLTDPNILGSAVPALTPIGLSLQAGMMEESLFRAVPLALGALIGGHYGRRGLGIAVALVLEALIFGGAHATYPGFPSYSRLVELILPSIVWGLIFLRFGLLPTMLLHALFDLSLFAIPVFLVAAPGALLQQAIIVAAALVPIAFIVVQRMRSGAWRELPDALRNGGWRPADARAEAARAREAPLARGRAAASFQRMLPVLGLIGLVGWIICSPWRSDVPPLSIDRAQAIATADAALAARHVTLGPEWRRTAVVRLASDDATEWRWHKFVWLQVGPERYRALVGNALSPPAWEVRYARFDGDINARAEEWRFKVAPPGTLRTLVHTLPESAPGAKLDKDAAIALAQRAVVANFAVDPAALKLVVATESTHPARTDWTLEFADSTVYVGNDAGLRYTVIVGGDTIAGFGRTLHIPQEWLRAEQERQNRLVVVSMGAGFLLALVAIALGVLAIIAWNRRRLDARAFWIVAALALASALIGLANRWPTVSMQLSTTEPLATQLVIVIVAAIGAGAVGALLFGLIGGVGAFAARADPRLPVQGRLPVWVDGVAAALLVGGIGAAFWSLVPLDTPRWPSLERASALSPALAAVLAGTTFPTIAAAFLFALDVLRRMTADWTRNIWLAAFPLFVVQALYGLTLGGGAGAAIVAAITASLASTVVFLLLLRHDPRTVPAYIATVLVLTATIRAAQAGTGSAWLEQSLYAVTIVVAAWLTTRYIDQPPIVPRDSAGTAVDAALAAADASPIASSPSTG